MQEFSPEWFDESSKAWRANKKRSGQSWKYLCSESLCKRVLMDPQILGERYCSKHSNNSLSEKTASLPILSMALPLAQEKDKEQMRVTKILQERRSPRFLLPLASKPPSSLGTYPSTRSSQRLQTV